MARSPFGTEVLDLCPNCGQYGVTHQHQVSRWPVCTLCHTAWPEDTLRKYTGLARARGMWLRDYDRKETRMPTSIDIVLVCPVHGQGEKPFEVDGTKFCSRCLRDYLASGREHRPVSIMEMTQVEKTYGEGISGPKTFCRCGHSWHGAGTACPKCGKTDHVSEPEAK